MRLFRWLRAMGRWLGSAPLFQRWECPHCGWVSGHSWLYCQRCWVQDRWYVGRDEAAASVYPRSNDD